MSSGGRTEKMDGEAPYDGTGIGMSMRELRRWEGTGIVATSEVGPLIGRDANEL